MGSVPYRGCDEAAAVAGKREDWRVLMTPRIADGSVEDAGSADSRIAESLTS
jgi:hypothetical protein